MERKEKLKKRFYAFYIDLVAIGIIQKVLVYTYVKCINELLTSIPKFQKVTLLDHTWQLTISTLSFTFFSYFLMSLYLNHGQTLGKSLLGLRVYSSENTLGDLSFTESLLRTITYTACYLTGSFLLLIPFLKKDSKGLPDYFSHTEVLSQDEFLMKLDAQKEEVDESKNSQLELFIAA
jgi:uncharacterized RDD family membrane protein YckC